MTWMAAHRPPVSRSDSFRRRGGAALAMLSTRAMGRARAPTSDMDAAFRLERGTPFDAEAARRSTGARGAVVAGAGSGGGAQEGVGGTRQPPTPPPLCTDQLV